MKHSELKREDFKSEVDYLIDMVNRYKVFFEFHLQLIGEDPDSAITENANNNKPELTN